MLTPSRLRSYEPPCAPRGTLFIHGREWQLAPGVKGYAFREGDRICIPLVVAEVEGLGDVGRFLDSLSPRCFVVEVCSGRLAGMLARRGFTPRAATYDGEPVEAWGRSEKVGEVARRK